MDDNSRHASLMACRAGRVTSLFGSLSHFLTWLTDADNQTLEPSQSPTTGGCGRTCALVTAGLLVACGIVAPVFALLNLNLPPAVLEEACVKGIAGAVRVL